MNHEGLSNVQDIDVRTIGERYVTAIHLLHLLCC